ncbi:hypothetical protein [Macrococcoides caseolyticum]|uniref:Uncharacterized protein n=1 Tax=Macrococcoides caseolyticum TaxID=69966 RepID=A0A855GVQ1_9STAP|nr:hypothetical protein [Macrococcus caseolyticus]PKE21700.1 hypothetical protein CW688_05955 [Macrococcus caseolyticus]PKE26895.1 hypothetical protein CW686_02955 [Macrococcus caseolyticus]PKE59529.1 hypothetical protein CW673_02435 [Macrococcus caseolyticus]PKE69929.1 hypothetical protein CW662_06430 [Macrococcus caseolyticus]PKE72337.1 hypothetical protein CW665_05840 [Macrococcus caseolyticus]
MTNLNDVLVDVKSLKLKVDALNNLVFSNLEDAEDRLEQNWIKENFTLRTMTEEQTQDLFILSTVISDVWKSVERLQDEIKKADTSRNTLASDEVPASNE